MKKNASGTIIHLLTQKVQIIWMSEFFLRIEDLQRNDSQLEDINVNIT